MQLLHMRPNLLLQNCSYGTKLEYTVESKKLMFRIHKYDHNYDRNEDFTRKLQFVITKVLQESYNL